MLQRLSFLPLLSIFCFNFIVFAGSAEVTARDVGHRMMCQCGCAAHVLDECGCGEAARELAKIGIRLDEGETADEIVASYVKQYGTVVLSAPPAEGFNLAAWILPFAVVLLGMVMLAFFLLKMRKRDVLALETAAAQAPGITPSSPADDSARQAIEEELRRLD